MATRADQQIISYRARDINTPWRFARYLSYSTAGHIALVVALFAVSSVSKPAPLFVPGYKVNLVSEKELKPTSLLKPAPVKKTTKKTIKKKRETKKKIKPAEKKIVPKKKKTKKKEPKPKPKKAPEVVKEQPKTKEAPAATGQRAAGQEFEYLWFLKIIERRITQNWITHGIDISGYNREPTVQFMLMIDGSVDKVKLLQSSGSQELDESVIMAVRKAAPFPALPEDYPENRRLVYFSFDYRQEGYE